jgi:hypothetical protein
VRRTAILLLAVAAFCAAARPARADVYDDNPAAASRGAGDLWVFARRTSDGAILERHLSNGQWTPFASIGGASTSGPAAAAYGPNIEVFIRGTDGALWSNQMTNGSWSGWASRGGYFTSGPSAIARRGTNVLDVAGRGGDNAIYLSTYVPGTGWSQWGSLGGNLTSAPALDSHSDGILDVFARGTDGSVQQQAWNGSQWLGWSSLGGGIIGAPTDVNRQPHDLDVYVRGGADALYQRHWDSVNGWGAFALLDKTPLGSAPAVASDGPGSEVLFMRVGDTLYQKAWNNAGGWTPWTDFGPIAVPPPPAPPPGDGELGLSAGLHCTPPGGRVHVTITIHKPKGKARARVARIVFFTRGKHRTVKVDRKRPFSARIRVNAPAGKHGRVYARVYFRRSKHGKLHHKTVSRRYTVCT